MLMSAIRTLLLAAIYWSALFPSDVLGQVESTADAGPAPAIAAKPDQEPEELVHPGDLIDVDIIGSTEFDWRGEITPEGFLSAFRFSENGVFALCRSTDEIAESVQSAYSKFLNDPKVKVSILDKSGRLPAVLFGAVRNQQRYRIMREVRLAELLVLSGGLTGIASGEISVLRQPSASCASVGGNSGEANGRERLGTSISFSVKVADLISGIPSANPQIVYGDIVTVEESPPVYVMGGIGMPSRVPFRAGLSLTRAVASSGGVSKSGDPRRVTVFRRSSGRSEVIKADLQSIEAGSTPDIELAAYDIVDVAQTGSSERRFSPVPEDDARVRRAEELPVRVID